MNAYFGTTGSPGPLDVHARSACAGHANDLHARAFRKSCSIFIVLLHALVKTEDIRMGVPSLNHVPTVADLSSDTDAVIVVANAFAGTPFAKHIADASSVDPTVTNVASCIIADVPGRRLITAPTGHLNRVSPCLYRAPARDEPDVPALLYLPRALLIFHVAQDIDDVRRVYDAAVAGVKRARAAGAVHPALVLDASIRPAGDAAFTHAVRVALAGALAACYVPLTVRKAKGDAAEPVKTIQVVWLGDSSSVSVPEDARVAHAIEVGKRISRDIGGSDPEAGRPEACAAYIKENLAGLPGVTVTIMEDAATIAKEYPLAGAVARSSLHVPRHHPRIVRLEYTPPAGVKAARHVFLVGKGITYDTGGADVKTGGHMAGMSRDKCGAASAAGFLATAATLGAPVRVTALLGFVRNSIGSDAYVADEIITSRSGARVLVVNTDAEGRMVLSDLLCHAKELALALPAEERAHARIHTVATLTGHAVLACGPAYSIAVDNGPARVAGVSASLFQAGALIGDAFEVSTLRREDYEFVAPKTPEYDVKQVNNAPSVATARGHQFPAAVMSIAAGLTKHGLDSEAPLAYTHIDCAGSSVAPPFIDGVVTGSVVAALTQAYC